MMQQAPPQAHTWEHGRENTQYVCVEGKPGWSIAPWLLQIWTSTEVTLETVRTVYVNMINLSACLRMCSAVVCLVYITQLVLLLVCWSVVFCVVACTVCLFLGALERSSLVG